ncbi:hypothetical protein OH76DRAFT_1559142 [Lentinus brumalis]|uniref:Uncharacterized protein n=1 Tax=Lentinus brumalis TaxID=2498619 RepID=A0A371CYH6_9APHY|nr:hypothetical protein OH76DRAFT_1559142 [Polyporus brumalis]
MPSTRLNVLVACMIAGSAIAAATTFTKTIPDGRDDQGTGGNSGGILFCTGPNLSGDCIHNATLGQCVSLTDDLGPWDNNITSVKTDECVTCTAYTGYLCNTPNPPEVPFKFGSDEIDSFQSYKEISSYICEYEYQCDSEGSSETLSGDA